MAADETALSFEQFVATRWAALFRTAYLLTGHRVDAEDVLQTTLVKAFASWAKVAKAQSAEAYVRRMLVNDFISSRRGSWHRRRTDVQQVEVPVPGHGDGVVDRLNLWDQVRTLPPRQRAVIVLRYYEDLTERQIAKTLGCSPGTVKSQASDALRSLRAGLQPEALTEGGVDERA